MGWSPLRALQQQKNRLATKLEREKLIIAKLPDLSVQIIDRARDVGRVTLSDIVTISGTNRSTLKDHLKRLVKQGQLVHHGSGKNS